MKLNLPARSLLAAGAALLPLTVCAAPRAHAPSGPHTPPPAKPPLAKPGQPPLSIKPFRPTGKAFILNTAPLGMDPSRGDHMAFGHGMHPERMDHMNTVTPVPTAPDPPKR